MAETPKTNLGQLTVTPVLDQKALGEVLANLKRALADVGLTLTESIKRTHEQQQAGALFALYREMRATTDPELSSGLEARWRAAIDGCETAYLADLITFSGHLAESARPVWTERHH